MKNYSPKFYKPQSLVISLCDNDFGSTFYNLLDTIYNLSIYLANTPDLTKEHLEYCIREGIKFHYIAFQHVRRDFWNKDPEEEKKSVEQTVKYLSRIKIYFDEEAGEFVKGKDHDSGSWFLDFSSGRSYSF